MYIEILENQKEIIDSAINRAGGYRKLAKRIDIPKSSLLGYKQKRVIPEERFKRIINFLNVDKNSLKIKRFEDNWKQILGGKACVKIKRENGTFAEQLKKAQRSGAKKLSAWHEKMKRENPMAYQLMQYGKFKKIYGYKCITIKGERVRNKLEKAVADKLTDLKINYEYEPLIKRKNKWFFPDFLIDKKIIIECTEWEGETKAYQLLEKIDYYEKDYITFVIIPKHLYMKYKILDKHLILGVDELARVAQLVRAHGC